MADTNVIERNTIIPESIISALREDFPRETHESRKLDNNFVQTGIKPAYVIERLNEILGMDGWDYKIEEERETSYEAMAKVTMNIYILKPVYTTDPDTNTKEMVAIDKTLIASRTQWGGNGIFNQKSISDAKKGAITNAICKCASMFDVAHKAYKGLLPPVEINAEAITDKEIQEAEQETANIKKKPGRKKLPTSEVSEDEFKKIKKELTDYFVEHGLSRDYLIKLAESNFGKSESKDLTPQECKFLLELVKEGIEKTQSVKENSENSVPESPVSN